MANDQGETESRQTGENKCKSKFEDGKILDEIELRSYPKISDDPAISDQTIMLQIIQDQQETISQLVEHNMRLVEALAMNDEESGESGIPKAL